VVPVVDLARRGQRFAAPFAARAEQLARSGAFLLGPELHAFERELASVTGGQCVAVSSGAAALQLTMAAMGIGAGDEVIVPAFTAVPTASAVAAVGATPVFADVHPATACVTTESVAAVRTHRTRAVVVVHLYGFPAPLPDTDVPIIQDAAQALGAELHTAASAATAYSFYPTKNAGGIGDGGAVATHDGELADRIRRLRVHGMTEQYVHTEISQNFRMADLTAVWLRLALDELEADVKSQREIAGQYRAAAPQLAWAAAHEAHAMHLCVFRHADRNRVREQLAEHGVGTAVHYPLSLPEQPAYRHLANTPAPAAAQWAAQCITVPCFPEMTTDEIDHVRAVLSEVAA
jgi:dTDP-3-amino-2,3,6-trideoxy-4-keto-D-glucose/dTDP-3-amino-3,4,6-trideoxy-alpha-D-glucose/dTDP-2,6-dideoxy-D-kanosamine transaminase